MAYAGYENDLTPEQRAKLYEIREFKELCERGERKQHIANWNRWDGLHAGYIAQRNDFASTQTENDRDEVIQNALREWGAAFHVPYAFAAIETMVPRALMNDPTMKVKPKAALGAQAINTEAIKAMFEDRQSEINYSLRLQPTARRGFKFGLGVQKTYWHRDLRIRRERAKGIFGRDIIRDRPVLLSEGPMAEDVDIFDFFWPTYAKDVETMDKCIHRTWRPFSYVKRMVETGQWVADLEKVKQSGSDSIYASEHAERQAAIGMSNVDSRAGMLHEVWEFHTNDNYICTVLDDCMVVQEAQVESTVSMPFQIFRPTLREGKFVGMGEIEPIEPLSMELDTLRQQRRDNATLILQKGFVYADGMVDPADLIVGPGKGIPVYGDPSQVIKELNWGDIPNSSYQESSEIKSDMEFAIGISESLAGSGGSAATATGEQLVQAAANVRVMMKTKLLQLEVLKTGAAHWLDLYRAHMPAEMAVPVETSGGYSFSTVTREDMLGVQAVLPDAGSTEPENRPQRVNDALATLNQLSGRQEIDQRKLIAWYVKELGIPGAETWITPEAVTMNPQVAEAVGHALENSLVEAGLEPEMAEELALGALSDAMQTTGVTPPPEGDEPVPQGPPGQAPVPQ